MFPAFSQLGPTEVNDTILVVEIYLRRMLTPIIALSDQMRRATKMNKICGIFASAPRPITST